MRLFYKKSLEERNTLVNTQVHKLEDFLSVISSTENTAVTIGPKRNPDLEDLLKQDPKQFQRNVLFLQNYTISQINTSTKIQQETKNHIISYAIYRPGTERDDKIATSFILSYAVIGLALFMYFALYQNCKNDDRANQMLVALGGMTALGAALSVIYEQCKNKDELWQNKEKLESWLVNINNSTQGFETKNYGASRLSMA